MRPIAAAGLLLLSTSLPASPSFQLILDTAPAIQGPDPAQRVGQAGQHAPQHPPQRLGLPPSASGSECTAVVLKGDSLAALASRHLGDATRWPEIQLLNHIRNPDLIGAGWTLEMPCTGFTNGTAVHARRDPRDPPSPVPEFVGDAETAAANTMENASNTHSEDRTASDDAGLSESAEAPTVDAAVESSERSAAGEDAAAVQQGLSRIKPAEAIEGSSGTAEADSPTLSEDCSVSVGSGQTLAALAGRHLGDATRWPEIQQLNRIRNPNLITVGQTLLLPCDIDATRQQVATDADDLPEHPEEPKPAVAAGSAPLSNQTVWTANTGELLDDVISRWAIEAGWTPIITERWYWVLDTDVSFSGSFLSSVRELLSGFSTAGRAPGVGVHSNRVLQLEYR